MQEAPYSVNFKLFNKENVQFQFTVRHEDPDIFAGNMDRLVGKLLEDGFTFTEQVKAGKVAGQYETDHIIGYMVGAIQKGKSAGEPVIYCYNNRSLFSAYYLYREDAHLFPAPWPKAPEYDGTAPDKETAINHRKYHKLEWDLPITPKTTPDGEIEKKNGYIQYKPNRDATLDGKPAPDNGKAKPSGPGKAPAYVAATVTSYTHKLTVPVNPKLDDTTLHSVMETEDSATMWWSDLAPAQRDTMSYARAFLRAMKKAPAASNERVTALLEPTFATLMEYVMKLARETGQPAPPLTMVLSYASWLLCDNAIEDVKNPANEMPIGVVVWLAQCAKNTLADGSPNTKYDPEWLEAFAEIILRTIRAQGEIAVDEDELPF